MPCLWITNDLQRHSIMRLTVLLFALLLGTSVQTQDFASLWSTADDNSSLYTLHSELLATRLASAPTEKEWQNGTDAARLNLPTPGGEQMAFQIWQSPTMSPGLAAQFPQITTYAGYAVANPSIHVRIDQTVHGFHAMVFGPGFTWYVDPVDHVEDLYQLRDKADHPAPAFDCATDALAQDHTPHPSTGQKGGLVIGDKLRTYRLAVATTGEFTNFHGGTVEGGLSAVVTIMHRINGIYERDISARMILIDSNHLVIYTNAGTDPYSGSNGAHLGQNQSNLDTVIGTENYDIGHVFDRGGGGIASLGSVCNGNRKGQGYTSTDPPEGDLFAVDYAAHEIGHQFDGNHTFNNCGGSGPQPYEPGSATTIMGYAGLCQENNVAVNSDAHFHVISLEEMTNFSILQNGNNCATIIDSINTPPTINTMPATGLFIPIDTPFELAAGAEDVDGDSLTYCWEQFDLGPLSPLGEPEGTAPSFRSRPPSNSPTRVFPQMNFILSNSSTINEVLPTYTRPLNFRLTVRDNAPIGGGVLWTDYSMAATANAGPFRVTSQNQATQWQAGELVNVTWDVAQTDQVPVATDSVQIYLSAPGGMTYPYALGGPVANDGSAVVQVPDSLEGTGYRIKVKGHNNVFFDLNNSPISIEAATDTTFSVFVEADPIIACAPELGEFTLITAGILGYNDPVFLGATGMPASLTVGVPNGPVAVPGELPLQIFGTDQVDAGTYPFSLIITSVGPSDTLELNLLVIDGSPAQVFLDAPADGSIDVSTVPTLSWMAVEGADSYSLEIATDPQFSDIIASYDDILETSFQLDFALPDSMQFYWQVQGNSSACGPGTPSVIRSFMTENINCKTYFAEDLPVEFNNLPFIQSRISVDEAFPVEDINIHNIQGSFFPLSELRFRLRSPNGEVIDLLTENDCSFSTEFDFSIDNDVPPSAVECPFNNGDTYNSEESFANVLGSDAEGTWRLFIYDNGTAGQLTNWELELCTTAIIDNTRPEPEQVSLQVFPNPSKGWINVRLPEQGSGTFTLLNLHGQEVLKQEIQASGQVDGRQLPAGMYTYRWLSENGTQVASGKIVLAK